MRTFYSSMRTLVFVLVFLMSSCLLQGPWDYSPANTTPFHGVEANATLIVGQPIQNICFSRMMSLTEEYTPAFAWYDSSNVVVTGTWSDGNSHALVLQANPKLPSCFISPLNLYPVAGGSYSLQGDFLWDSSGTKILSHLKGSTTLPKSFALIHQKGALANINAYYQALTDSSSLLFANLPDSARQIMMATWGDSISQYGTDSASFSAFLSKYGPQIQKQGDSLAHRYGHSTLVSDGDTIYYLAADSLNNIAIDFMSKYDSASLGGVLISQRLDSTADIPANIFSSISAKFNHGIVSPASLASTSTIRQDLFYQNQSVNGKRVLDSIPLLNSYLIGGLNRIYFYAFDTNYVNYVETYVNNNGKHPPVFNITGGWGFFSGAIVDSFNLYVQIPTGTTEYSYFEALAATCSKGRDGGGWNNKICRLFEPNYCATVGYNEQKYASQTKLIGQYKGWKDYDSCYAQEVFASLNQGLLWNTLAQNLSNPIPDTAAQHKGQLLYCFSKNMNPSLCANFISELATKDTNSSTRLMWNYCLDRNWSDSAGFCLRALASYSLTGASQSSILDEHATEYCQSNPTDPFCQIK